jgi:hypothetical protein
MRCPSGIAEATSITLLSVPVRVNGRPVPYLRISRFEAERTEKLLSRAAGFPVAVRSALVLLTGTLIPNVTIKQRPEDVLILDRMDIPGAFRRAKQRLTPEETARIFDIARRCTTWTCAPSCDCAKSS